MARSCPAADAKDEDIVDEVEWQVGTRVVRLGGGARAEGECDDEMACVE